MSTNDWAIVLLGLVCGLALWAPDWLTGGWGDARPQRARRAEGMVRHGADRHECAPPEHGRQGDVWRCGCGRRWECLSHVTCTPNLVTMRAHWVRRYLPWPR